MRTSVSQWSLVIAMAGPPSLGCLVAVACLIFAAVGSHPLWPVTQMTMAEAAALRDTGEIARRVQTGESPNAVGTVRSGVLRSEVLELMPVEAAVAANRPDVLRVLIESGVIVDPDRWLALHCFAVAVGAKDAQAFLDRLPSRSIPSAACVDVPTPW